MWASWCSNRTTRFSLGSYFLGRGPRLGPVFSWGICQGQLHLNESVGARNFRIQRGGLSKFSNPRAAHRATLESKARQKLPRWRSTCFRPYPAQLKTGPSGDGATSGVGETVNFIGGARLASGQKLVDELCSAQDQARTSKPRESAKDSRRTKAVVAPARPLKANGAGAHERDKRATETLSGPRHR